ncbi:MAG: hypothetical protein FJ241_09815 [Nitrospira sp.]|nr:hypothetical protein [Nitrospira sp.]
MAEVIVAIAVIYFLLGGDTWSPKMWAVFAIVAAWIIIMNVRKEAGLETEKSYLRWKQRLGLLMVLSLLFSPLWVDSWWPFFIGLVLGLIWLDDYRSMKTLFRKNAEATKSNRPDHTDL